LLVTTSLSLSLSPSIDLIKLRPLCQVEPNKFVFEAADADDIHELAFFILPGNVLPDEYIACLYASGAPYDDWLLLGSVTQDSPSTISLVRWKKPVGAGSSARFGVSVETRGSSSALTGQTLRSTSFTIDDTKEFARAIATDLFRYLDSFGHSVGQHAMTTLDKWFLRFSSKMERDPEFWKRIANRD